MARLDVGHELHGGVRVRGEGEAGSQLFGDELVVVVIGDTDVVARPGFGGAEERLKFIGEVRVG